MGGLRNDPIFNRLAADIHAAVKQFDAVNPKQEVPNVIALVNHDHKCGFDDLLAVLTGNFYADNGIAHPVYSQFSEGRIKDDKARIHLFIWFDDYKPDRLLFSQTNERLHLELCKWFRIRGRGDSPSELLTDRWADARQRRQATLSSKVLGCAGHRCKLRR